MASVLIKGGRVLSPADGLDGKFDIRIEDSIIKEIAPDLAGPADETLDARRQVVSPGLVDVHVHLREPGGEISETFESGLRAAVAGGFTSVCAMPNTQPVNDRPELTRRVIEQTQRLGLARVFPIAAVSMGSQGESLTDFKALVAAGAIAFSDDGRPVKTAGLLKRAMLQARELGAPIIDHCEDMSLSLGGLINEGEVASRLHLKGAPSCSEDVCVARDLIVAEATGAHLHVAHLSTARAVEMVKVGKRREIHVTAEVAPHHFALTDQAVLDHGTNAKMNPPLRSPKDVETLLEGLADGTIDAIATDHAPHAPELKQKPMDQAPFGVIGLETALGLALTHLVHTGRIPLARLILLMSTNPARIINKPLGRLRVGDAADITIIDPGAEWIYHATEGHSKSRNTPFEGWKLKGAVTATIIAGKVVYRGR